MYDPIYQILKDKADVLGNLVNTQPLKIKYTYI